jgi:hypothetical protein
MDGWDDRYLAQCQFLFYKNVFRKMDKSVGRSTDGAVLNSVREIAGV